MLVLIQLLVNLISIFKVSIILHYYYKDIAILFLLIVLFVPIRLTAFARDFKLIKTLQFAEAKLKITTSPSKMPYTTKAL